MLHVRYWSVSWPSDEDCAAEAARVGEDPSEWLEIVLSETNDGRTLGLRVTPPSPATFHLKLSQANGAAIPGFPGEVIIIEGGRATTIESPPLAPDVFDRVFPVFTDYGWSFHAVPDARVLEALRDLQVEFPVTEGKIVHFHGVRARNFAGLAIWPDSHAMGDISVDHAVDIAAPIGTPVVAGVDGIVVFANDRYRDLGCSARSHPDASNRLKILSRDGAYTLIYAHLMQDSLQVEVGDQVRRGQVVAAVGNSGASWTPHLHLAATTMDTRGTVTLPVSFSCRGTPIAMAVATYQCLHAGHNDLSQRPRGILTGQVR